MSFRLICLLFLFGISIVPLHAQYNNDWINFSQSYVKMKVGANGIYRIPKSTLESAGMGSVKGLDFSLFKDGLEVPIYVTNNDIFESSDFIEFYGVIPDGKLDTDLYLNSEYQTSNRYNLLTDTSVYFLTHSTGSHLRGGLAANIIPVPEPLSEPNVYYESFFALRPNVLAPGKSITNDVEFQSSRFDAGEGFLYAVRAANAAVYSLNIVTTNRYNHVDKKSKLKINIVGASRLATTNHNTKVTLNNNLLWEGTYPKYSVQKKEIEFATSLMTSNTSNVRVTEAFRYGLGDLSIEYPRTLVLPNTGVVEFKFALEPGSASRFLKFTGLSSATHNFILYDVTHNKKYLATTSGGTLKFNIEALSSYTQFHLMEESLVNEITSTIPVQFINYADATYQGEYLILSTESLINASPNYVTQFAQYRNSSIGGGFSTTIINADNLYDQFYYGYEYHHKAVFNFLKFAHEQWASKPKFVFIVGKGLQYSRIKTFVSNRSSYEYQSIIPTYGHPGSDNLLVDFDEDDNIDIPIGRLSAWNNEEVGNYLKKVKKYEDEIRPNANATVENSYWKKTGLHIAGGRDIVLQTNTLKPTLAQCEKIYNDTLTGGIVNLVAKNTSDPISGGEDGRIDDYINSGASHITYYGHASSTGFEYNLNTPDNYHSSPRFPHFYGFGCDVSQIFQTHKTVGEAYLNSIEGGSISMIASDNYSYPSILRPYMLGFYEQIAYKNYGKRLGEQFMQNMPGLSNAENMKVHKQSILLQGDPALLQFSPDKADYYTELNALSHIPSMVSSTDNQFELKAIIYNLGKASHDSVQILIEHSRQSNPSEVLKIDSVMIKCLHTDTVKFIIPIDKDKDEGMNLYTVKINEPRTTDEINFNNNQATLQLFIADDGLTPIEPFEFAIVNKNKINLKASTLNIFSPAADYIMEIDTTEQFNSPLKEVKNINATGGVIMWTPSITLMNNTVYYWRAARNVEVNGVIRWKTSSFVYLNNSSSGWNQSHYYQYKKDEPFQNVRIDSVGQKFRFATINNVIDVLNRVYYNANGDAGNIKVALNDVNLGTTGCNLTGTIQFSIFDPLTGMPWKNPPTGINGSIGHCDGKNVNQFEFRTSTPEFRNEAAQFMDTIPENSILVVKNYINVGPPNNWNRKVVSDWIEDEAIYGTSNTLYTKLKNLGFNLIDSFDNNRTFIFIRKVGVENATYPVKQIISADSLDLINLSYIFKTNQKKGFVQSTLIGPAVKWDQLKWETSATDGLEINDNDTVKIFGIEEDGSESLIYETINRDTSLSFINAKQFPKLKLQWNTSDSIDRTISQLNYWRVNYTPLPEIALNPQIAFEFKDSLIEGQKTKLKLGIQSLNEYPMDSVLIKYKLIDAQNNTHELAAVRTKPMTGLDSLITEIEFQPSSFIGNNILFIEANPDNDQAERYHPNNLAYLNLYVHGDKFNPLMDVTFDGIHILDKDLVSGKPFIKVQIRDENVYARLADTNSLTLSLTYPDQTEEQIIPFDGTICKFIPADTSEGKINEAFIEFKPELKIDGIYKLTVKGKDKSGNKAGNAQQYDINFSVENKSTISHVLNYPNPFSTSTSFVFTLSGSEIPSQFKIQILTVTGKIVREITKQEIGVIRIGRNISEYKWDGKDQYGQTLGNGVYLYRVVTNINGEGIEHRASKSVDQYFKNGFGKLYIMR